MAVSDVTVSVVTVSDRTVTDATFTLTNRRLPLSATAQYHLCWGSL
jgi:hypothetical protein